MATLLPFTRAQGSLGLVVSAYGVSHLHDGLRQQGSAHSVATINVDGREWLYCMTCHDGGHDVARELFTDDPGTRMCPVEAANNLLRATVEQLWSDSVGHALRSGERESQDLRALLARVSS